jgi:hypothetical protein
MPLLSRRLYEVVGLACGFVLVDYGFNFIAAGFPGARQFTSQFLGGNLLVGGSAIVFISLYYLLKPAAPAMPSSQPQVSGAQPDVGVELIVEEETPPKSNFYRNIAYIGYFFTILGLFSAGDLVLQVFLRSTYSEARWWVEILLVVFGILSYTIFGSIGRLGAQEEARLIGAPIQPKLVPENVAPAERVATTATPMAPSYPESLEIHVRDFTKASGGEYEKHLSETAYDMFRTERDMITVWREDRIGMRTVYLAGPYELARTRLLERVERGEDLRIGALHLSVESIQELLALSGEAVQTPAATKAA